MESAIEKLREFYEGHESLKDKVTINSVLIKINEYQKSEEETKVKNISSNSCVSGSLPSDKIEKCLEILKEYPQGIDYNANFDDKQTVNGTARLNGLLWKILTGNDR